MSHCSTYGLRSVLSDDVKELIVVNAVVDRSAKLYWIDMQGEKQHYATIPPMSRHVQGTFSGHAWCCENPYGDCDIVFVMQNNIEITIKT